VLADLQQRQNLIGTNDKCRATLLFGITIFHALPSRNWTNCAVI
jgi:hypothetical protein